jgi:hypothetical protein
MFGMAGIIMLSAHILIAEIELRIITEDHGDKGIGFPNIFNNAINLTYINFI